MQQSKYKQLEDEFFVLIKNGQKTTIVNGYEVVIPKVKGWRVKKGEKVLDEERECRAKAQLLVKQLIDAEVLS